MAATYRLKGPLLRATTGSCRPQAVCQRLKNERAFESTACHGGRLDRRKRGLARATAGSDWASAPQLGSRRTTLIQVLTRIKSLKLARIAPILRESGAFRGFPPKAQTPIIAQAISTAGGSDRTRISPTGEQPATTSLQGSPKGQAWPPRRCSCATLR